MYGEVILIAKQKYSLRISFARLDKLYVVNPSKNLAGWILLSPHLMDENTEPFKRSLRSGRAGIGVQLSTTVLHSHSWLVPCQDFSRKTVVHDREFKVQE